MNDEVVCLGCGLLVGGACCCPPPSGLSKLEQAGGDYRSLPAGAECPRCKGRLLEITLHDSPALDCRHCGGLFLPKATIDALGRPENGALRLAFPRRPRLPEPTDVVYLCCPLCKGRMNRVNFARVTGVIVDICKDDGIWFDQGEVNAVIAFVERGGLEHSRERERISAQEEKAKLRAEWLVQHEAAQRASLRWRNRVEISPGERALLAALGSWFRR